jgi:hypothetical protein
MSTVEVIYMTDGKSGDIWAVEVAHGGEANGDVDLITGTCGPLHYTEVTQANLDDRNFNFDTEPEQLEWAEDNLTKRIDAPFAGDI